MSGRRTGILDYHLSDPSTFLGSSPGAAHEHARGLSEVPDQTEKPFQVQATFHYDHAKSLEKLKVGQKVKLKGTFGYAFNRLVAISEVILVE